MQYTIIYNTYKNESKHSEMGPVRQNPIQRPVRSVHVCALHCPQLLHTILHRTDLIIFPLTLEIITIAPMMSIWGKGVKDWSNYSFEYDSYGSSEYTQIPVSTLLTSTW